MREKNFHIDITDKTYRNLLFLSYGMVAAVVIAVMTVTIFTWFRSYVRNVMSDMAQTQLTNLDNVVISDIETFQTQLLIAFQNPDVKNYLYSQRVNPSEQYAVSRFLIDMCVVNGLADYVGVFRSEEDFEYYGVRWPEEKERDEIQQKIFETTDDSQFFIVKSESRTLLCIYATDRDYLGGTPQRGLIYAINVKGLERQLISQKDTGAMFLVFSEQGETLLGNNLPDHTIAKVWSYVENQKAAFESNEIVIDHVSYLSSSQRDTENALYVVMVQDYEGGLQNIADMSRYVYLAIFISFLIVLAASVCLTKWLYYPLEHFLVNLRVNVGIDSKEDEYSRRMTQISADKILSQINIMSKRYHSNQVLEYLEDSDNMKEIPDILRLSSQEEQCFMLLYWTDKAIWPNTLPAEIATEWERQIRDCKVNTFGDAGNPWFLVLLKGVNYAGQMADISAIESIAMQVNQKIGETCTVMLYCAMSELISEEESMKECFAQLVSCVKYLLLDSCLPLMTLRTIQEKHIEEIPKKKYEEILADVKAGREEAALQKIPDIVDSLGEYEIHVALLFLAEMCVQIKLCVSGITDGNLRKTQESYLDNYLKITSMHNRVELEKYLELYIHDICFERSVFLEKSLRMNMLDVVEYIQEHYCDRDISVESIAERFHISASYFSKLFNEYVGMTFPEYVGDLRLTYAKELLKMHPEFSVKKIADLCGFSSVSYFSNQFKRKWGISPSVFKS